jgi:hemoglobin-like flavoprotein
MEKFYANFKASHPSIPPFFVKTNMAMQHKLLKEGITFLLMSPGGSSFGQTEMKKLVVRHDPSHLNVKSELYRYWVEALMKTVKEFDQSFAVELDKKWRTALQLGIQQLIDTYEQVQKSA